MNKTSFENLKSVATDELFKLLARKQKRPFNPIDFIEVLDAYNTFNHYMQAKLNKNNCIRFREFESKCIKYIKLGNRTSNKLLTDFFFNLYETGIYKFPRRYHKLSSYIDLFNNPADEDKECCKKYFHYECIATMIYRKIKFYVFLDYNYAIMFDAEGKDIIFPLGNDWWFNIDNYLLHRI